MSRFEYTLPSGAEFVVIGPPGATPAEADKIFYEQVAAGSLVGYESGQTLTSLATRLTKFELSRLDRGTAGVENSIVLSIGQGVVLNTDSVATTQSVLAAVQQLPLPTNMPDLSQVVLTDPIDQSDIILAKGDDQGPSAVGPLTDYQVQKILAQITKLVNQDYTEISQEKGIGKYGFSAYALEQAGYVKPGTTAKYFVNGYANFVDVMSSPSVWTGREGIYELNDLLDSAETQTQIQNQLMSQEYLNLTAIGAISTPPVSGISFSQGQVYNNGKLQSVSSLLQLSSLTTLKSGAVSALNNLSLQNFNTVATTLSNRITADVGALVTNASKFGSQITATWAKAGDLSLDKVGTDIKQLSTQGLARLGNLANQSVTSFSNLAQGTVTNITGTLNNFAKAGTFATNFANPLNGLNLPNLSSIGNLFGGGGDLVSGVKVAAGFNNTVNRATVDAAFGRILGSNKIPRPVYEYPSLATAGARLDILQAQNFLKSLQTSGGSVVNTGTRFGQTVTI